MLPLRLAEQARERREERQRYATALDPAADEEDADQPSLRDADDETGEAATENRDRE